MRHEMIDDQHKAFETRLRGLRPATPALDRDRLMFRAGQRAATRGHRLWPTLTIASWIACAAAIGLLISRPAEIITTTRVVERIVRVPETIDSSRHPQPTTIQKNSMDSDEAYVVQSRDNNHWSLDEIDGPLTAGAWQTWQNNAPDDHRALAAAEQHQSLTTAPGPPSSPPKTYGELRQEMMNSDWNGSLNNLF